MESDAPIENLARLLHEIAIPFAVIGGHAVNYWLTPRLTRDIDLTVEAAVDRLGELRTRLAEHGFAVTRAHGAEQPSGPDFIRFLSRNGNVIVEIQVAKTGLQRELIRRAVAVGKHIRVATAEDLVVLKLIANRQKDRADMVGLAGLAAIDWQYVVKRAEEWGVADRLHRLRQTE